MARRADGIRIAAMREIADGVWQLSGWPPRDVTGCFGHGKPLRDTARFTAAVAQLAG
jgi:hypothetical protein